MCPPGSSCPGRSSRRGCPSGSARRWALRGSGGLKAGTPLETASTPVSATEPEAKARRISSSPSAFEPCCCCQAAGAVYAGRVPVA